MLYDQCVGGDAVLCPVFTLQNAFVVEVDGAEYFAMAGVFFRDDGPPPPKLICPTPMVVELRRRLSKTGARFDAKQFMDDEERKGQPSFSCTFFCARLKRRLRKCLEQRQNRIKFDALPIITRVLKTTH